MMADRRKAVPVSLPSERIDYLSRHPSRALQGSAPMRLTAGELKAMALRSKSLALIVDETGSDNLEEMQNMALVGHSLMAAIAAIQHEGSDWKDWAPADDPAEIVIDLFSALQDARASASANMVFPERLTDDLREVLSTMLWTSGQVAACLRAGGEEINRRAEDEQANVLHWLTTLALRHGPDWRKKASERIEGCRAATSAQEPR